MLLPSVLFGDKEKPEDLQQQGRPNDSRRKSTVYESASVIAEEIQRPAMVQDATRAEVEALYDFKSCLASGGTGTVWRAVDRRTGAAVAIKVIDKKKLNPALFNMEVFAMQRCSGHPHIVQLLAAFDVPPSAEHPNGEWHVVMELAEGGELFERLLRHGAYTELVASEITRQIASAVYHMHSCGVVHRDLKPENLVLMTESDAPHVKIIDFGTAIILEENEQVIANGKVGTWTYWAPEQVDNGAPYDSAVDMWSLGVVLYIMLSGRHPFEKSGVPPEAVLQQIFDAQYVFDPHIWKAVSGRAQRLVSGLLAKPPAARLTAAQLMSNSWIRGENVPERPMPEAVERLRVFQKATTAIHGSLLLAVLLHQEETVKASAGRRTPHDGGEECGGEEGAAERIRRSISASEGVGITLGSGPTGTFDVMRAAYALFDPTNKGYIAAADLVRVCKEVGVELSEQDVENMLSVLAPTSELPASSASVGSASSGGDGRAGASGTPAGAAGAAERSRGISTAEERSRAISYDKFASLMQSGFRRSYARGEAVFSQGDAVREFYILLKGECVVLREAEPKPRSDEGRGGEGRGGEGRVRGPREVTRLGPGDFFGETGLLEGRTERNTTVRCATPVELLAVDKAMFLQLTKEQGSTLTRRMHERFERRQRTRLKRAIEMLDRDVRSGESNIEAAPLARLQLRAGQVVYAQGEPASSFYIVSRGELQAVFTSSSGEHAALRSYTAGDQFGYDAMFSERYDTSVTAKTDVELIAVPKELVQYAIASDDYFQSVWVAPASSSQKLRRMASLAIAGPNDPRRPSVQRAKSQRASQLIAEAAGAATSYVGDVSRPTRLAPSEFDRLCAQGSDMRLAQGEAAFEQGSAPEAVYMLRDGMCHVEYSPPTYTRPGREEPAPPPAPTRTVATLWPGDHFGESAVLEGRKRRRSAVRCVAEGGCELSVLSKESFMANIALRHELKSLFTQGAAERESSRLRAVVEEAAERSPGATVACSAGEVLYEQGDAADKVFLVNSGCIESAYRAEDGRLLPVRRYQQGEVFGVSGLFSGDETRRDAAHALEPSVLRCVSHSELRQLMSNDALLLQGLLRASSAHPVDGKAEVVQKS